MSIPRRFRLASHAARTYSGLPLIARAAGFLGSRTLPNLVAITTRARWGRSARPTSSSFAPMPYMSAVSKNVMPSSSARWIVAIDSASSPAP